ncbi:MAG: hypothetical protein WBS20_18185, partial [Lysobacterales bacterium]
MSNFWINIVAAVVLLAAAIPYVMRIRHPKQKPLAAYLIFVLAFAVTYAVIFNLLALMANVFGLGAALDDILPALIFLFLVFVPAVFLATWLARKPPWRQ